MVDQPNLSATLGALEIGVLVSIFLFGVVTVQTFTYYKKFPDDRWSLRAFVGFIWVLELLHAIGMIHMIYYYSVIRYGDLEAILELTAGADIFIFMAAIIAPAVEGFFAHRIYALSSRWIIPSITWLLCLLRCISTLPLGVVCHGTQDLLATKDEWQWLFVTTFVLSATTDVFNTVSLCYYLWPHRGTNFRSTKTIIDKLILWTIQTGLVTSCDTTIQLILFFVHDDYIWVAFYLISTRLFSNSLMASLNARTNFRSYRQSSDFKPNSNLYFGLQPTYPAEISIAMESIREQCSADIELGRAHGPDSGRAELH
ncbi:hypothetical protein H2248_010291 [Termitomyces sp. 'cryptogamus']|nr:hypothetical protein H2248_010291 [Termitomyces sp. 'cryptogamus']